ncbi:MAG: M14 family zinc carboxypeptidase [candidate division Zixibacteria bacterium]|nr:M14 family zinc carboxypeptidase [candidate division Zixibacteria bacterium]
MFKRLILLAFVALLSLAVAPTAEASQYYFKFNIQSPKELDELTKIVSIDNVKDDTVYAYANDREFAKFKATGYSYTILPNPGDLIVPDMARSLSETKAWDVYPTYQQYLDMMNQFEYNHGSICKLINIGSTVEGRQLLVLKISDNVNSDEDEPEAFYSSTMHGDEVTGYVMMLRLIDSLLTSYGTDTRITNLINNTEIYINPLANPDGTYRGGDGSVSGAIRYNANWVDPNRNFPDPADGNHPDGLTWQPETIAMMDFMSAHHFVISANFHGGAEVFNYPWDTWSRLHPDDTWWQQTGRRFADTVHASAVSSYMTDLQDGITNGYAWYRVTGGRQDYMTYFQHGREATIEISGTKMPQASTLPNYWTYLRKSLLNYLSEALYGVRGVATSAATGLPLAARVTVMSHDADSSQVYSDPTVGDYHRLIAPGTWTLKFEATGYVPQTITGVSVADFNTTILNVQLQPESPDTTLGIVTATVPGGWVNKAYSQQMNASGGTGPYSWSDLNGDLVGTGLTLSSGGLLSGTPAHTGQIDFTANVQDEAGGSTSRAYSFKVYLNGDADGSDTIDVSDAVYIIAYIFSGGPAPVPTGKGDTDCSNSIDISDAVFLISYIFSGGPAPCAAS